MSHRWDDHQTFGIRNVFATRSNIRFCFGIIWLLTSVSIYKMFQPLETSAHIFIELTWLVFDGTWYQWNPTRRYIVYAFRSKLKPSVAILFIVRPTHHIQTNVFTSKWRQSEREQHTPKKPKKKTETEKV